MSADRKMDGDSSIATGQQMSFLHFPTEIQMQIFSHFCFHCTQEPICPETTLALHNCSLVCKSWRAFTVPLMWHQPSLSGNRRVKFLTGLFSENPQLAKHVESIRYNLPHRPFPASLIESDEEDEGPEFFTLTYEVPFEQYFDVGLHPPEEYVGLDMQAFLAVVDKIKSLSLRGMWDTNLFGYLANRQHRLGLDYLFPKLRSVLIQGDPFPCRIYSGASDGEMAIQDRRLDCRILLQMAPNLHTLELYGMGRIDEPISNNRGEACVLRQPLPTRLRNIRFLDSVFLGDEDKQLFLRPLLEHCASLERFTMQLRACQCLAVAGLLIKLVSPGDLVDMLETQKNSLRYLELNYLDPEDLLSPVDNELKTTAVHFTTNAWYVSSNLATFPVLEELHIDEHSFCRHWQTRSYVPHTCLTDIVPQSLQRLLVWVRPYSRAWEDIGHFCNQVARGRYTNLQRVNLVFYVSYHDFPDEFIVGDQVPGVTRDVFMQKARKIKHLLEASKVVFRAGILAGDPRDGSTKDFRFLSDDLEEFLDMETLELPFSSDEDLWHDRCS